MFADRQGRRHDDGRDDREGRARRGSASRRRTSRSIARVARRRLALHLSARLLPRRRRRRPAGTTSCSRTSACRMCCGSCRASRCASKSSKTRSAHEAAARTERRVEPGVSSTMATPGTLTPVEYDDDCRRPGELTCDYMGEPAQRPAHAASASCVLLSSACCSPFAYALKNEYLEGRPLDWSRRAPRPVRRAPKTPSTGPSPTRSSLEQTQS